MKVSVENGIPGWSRAAVDLLQEVAGTFNATITSSDFAEEVQRRSGRWANVASKGWVRKVLAVVTLKCQREEWPYLSALVVRPSDGRIGPWYGDVLAITGPGDAPDEQHHAAGMRLQCYRAFGADVPEGAVPTLRPVSRTRVDDAARRRRSGTARNGSPAGGGDDAAADGGSPAPAGTSNGEPAARASRRRPQARPEERTGGICPTCFMQMPLTGECPNCG